MVFSFFIAWLRQAQPPCYSRCLSLSKAEVIFCSSGDFDSAQSPCYFRCLSLSKADSYSSRWFRQAQSPCYSRCLSLSKAHSYSHPCDFYSAQSPCCFRCLSLSKAHSHSYSLWFRLRSINVLFSVPEPVEGTFSLIILWFRQAQSPCYFRCLSLSKAGSHSSSCDFDKLNHRVTLGAWACRRHILTHTPCDFGSAQSTCCFRCLSLSKAHSYSHPCDFYSAQSPCYSRCLSLSKAQYINPYLYNFLIIKANRLLCSPSKPLSFSCSNPEPAFLDKKLHLFCQILRNRPIAQAIFFGCG